MNMQEFYDAINKFIEIHADMDTAKDIMKILNLLNTEVKDDRWVDSAKNLLKQLKTSYPSIIYYIGLYDNKIKLPYSQPSKLCHYLIIAGLCIDIDLFIDSKKFNAN